MSGTSTPTVPAADATAAAAAIDAAASTEHQPEGPRLARLSRLASLALLGLPVAAPFIGLYPLSMMQAMCFAVFACAFNLLLGFTGLLSFGHAAYLGAACRLHHRLAGAQRRPDA